MSPGEYRAASLGSLFVILVALGIWAAIWGPDGDDADESPAEPTGTTSTTTVAVPPTTGEDSPDEVDDDPNVDGPVVRRPLPHTDEGEDAAIWGTLELNDGCLHLAFEEVEVRRFALVWPGGTSWDASTLEVILATGDRVGVGEPLDASGGYYQPEALAALGDLSPGAIELLARCATGEHREVARINNQANAARPAG